MEISEDKFNKIREDAEKYYYSIGRIKCPYFNEDIHFNSEGFEHLLFKSWNKTRSRSEQYMRLRLLSLVCQVISKSHTLQEYEEKQILVRQKINSRWEKRNKLVYYYVFVAIIKDCRVKVIIKEITGGEKFFYSLYPSWKVVVDVNGNQRKVFYSGDLEMD